MTDPTRPDAAASDADPETGPLDVTLRDIPTFVTVVVDRSGSMEPLRGAVVEGINELVASLDPQATVTIVQFDSEAPYDVIVEATSAGSVERVAYDQYQPRGGTPLYDAVGIAIARTAAQVRELEILAGITSRVVLGIVTDGYENASREYTGAQIARLLEHYQGEGWTVTYVGLGLGEAAFREARSMGIHAESVSSLTSDSRGTAAAFMAISEVANSRPRRSESPQSR